MNKPTPIPITKTNDQYQQPTPMTNTSINDQPQQDQSVYLHKSNAPNETNKAADVINYYAHACTASAHAHARIIFHMADTSQNGSDVHKI